MRGAMSSGYTPRASGSERREGGQAGLVLDCAQVRGLQPQLPLLLLPRSGHQVAFLRARRPTHPRLPRSLHRWLARPQRLLPQSEVSQGAVETLLKLDRAYAGGAYAGRASLPYLRPQHAPHARPLAAALAATLALALALALALDAVFGAALASSGLGTTLTALAALAAVDPLPQARHRLLGGFSVAAMGPILAEAHSMSPHAQLHDHVGPQPWVPQRARQRVCKVLRGLLGCSLAAEANG